MSSGKRMAESEGFDFGELNWKKIGIVAGIIAVVIAVVCFSVHMVNKRGETKEVNAGNENKVEEPVAQGMQAVYKGYPVLGQLYIDKIGVEQYILDSTDNAAMEVAPVKLYGGTINTEGNFCIAGHNYDEIFKKLGELKVDDTFTIIDRNEVGQDYTITEVTEVEPTDLNVLMPVQGKKQVTLITCVEGSTKRLVIKAEARDVVATDGDGSDNQG